jgi:hypothetical protein
MQITITLPDLPTPEEYQRAHAVIDALGVEADTATLPLEFGGPFELEPGPPGPVLTVELDTTSPAVAASTDTAGECDTRGMPWDDRIHSGSRARNKDGSWRGRRGVDPAVVAQVEAELLGATCTAPAEQPVDAADVFALSPDHAPIPPAPVAQPPLSATDYSEVIAVTSELITAGRVTPDRVTEICATIGLNNIVELTVCMDKIPQFMEHLNDAIGS